ncbi:MAG: adenylyl-sulfate kinase [Planctomycetaceae bacterium]
MANTVDHMLHALKKHSYILDGDNIRMGLNKNLKFSAEDRAENIRRIGEVAKLFAHAGNFTLTAFISPTRPTGTKCERLLEPGEFIEIYVDASLETCSRSEGLVQESPRRRN